MIYSWRNTKSMQRSGNGSILSLVLVHCFWFFPLFHSNYIVELTALKFVFILSLYRCSLVFYGCSCTIIFSADHRWRSYSSHFQWCFCGCSCNPCWLHTHKLGCFGKRQMKRSCLFSAVYEENCLTSYQKLVSFQIEAWKVIYNFSAFLN